MKAMNKCVVGSLFLLFAASQAEASVPDLCRGVENDLDGASIFARKASEAYTAAMMKTPKDQKEIDRTREQSASYEDIRNSIEMRWARLGCATILYGRS